MIWIQGLASVIGHHSVLLKKTQIHLKHTGKAYEYQEATDQL
jgi:hypothetical protein